MSENGTKKIKVFRKIVKVAPVQPEPVIPVAEPEEQLPNEFQNQEFDFEKVALAVTSNAHQTSSETKTHEEEVEEDDEFERLLNQFINSELDEVDTGLENNNIDPNSKSLSLLSSPTQSSAPIAKSKDKSLNKEEKALFEAYKNFTNAIEMMAGINNMEIPTFKLEASALYPHYKAKTGAIIAADTLKGWDIMIQAQPNHVLDIQPGASDEELLDFAEVTTDEILQLALISYVEILIEIEGCEIAYEERKIKSARRKIEREIYEEHQKRVERKKRYIEAIEKKKFPIDADKLINNYFKTAQKDPEGAYKVLINNPAVYAPINISKLRPRFFGLIKPTPQDGIRVNREIGDFLKKIKV